MMAESRRVEIEAAIRAQGRRVTAQRALILEALQALPGHQTVEDIHRWVQQRDPGAEMALSTVYRTLNTLAAIGIVTTIDDGAAGTRYEWASGAEPHHHLVCDRCGRRAEVRVEAVDEVVREVERRHGFVAEIRHLAIRGECGHCRERRETG
jgi:Fe2+ or Zn2+ uptake regulation protein